MDDGVIEMMTNEIRIIGADIKTLLQKSSENTTRITTHDIDIRDLKAKSHDAKSCTNTANLWWVVKLMLVAIGIVATVVGGLLMKALAK